MNERQQGWRDLRRAKHNVNVINQAIQLLRGIKKKEQIHYEEVSAHLKDNNE